MNDVTLINAGAGSGKTYALTGRVVQAFRDGIHPEGLMATTFTNRAAGELRERIRLDLLASGDRDAARRVYDGLIGTVNSMCGRLLQEFALEAGLSPALDVLPEDDADELFRMAIASELEEYAPQLEAVARRLGHDGSGVGYAKASDWRDDVDTIVKAARSNLIGPDELRRFARESHESLIELFGLETTEGLTERLRRETLRALEALLVAAPETKVSQKAIEQLHEFARAMERPEGLPWTEWVRISKLKTGKAEAGLVERVRTIAGQCLEHPGLRSDLRTLIEGVFRCAASALEAYQHYKREQGLMDFVDQERQLLDLARDNPGVREALTGRLERLMVDEFQDTSPIQLALFLELHGLAGRSVWVGDPKQAIYGFRGADPELMQQVVERLSRTENLPYSWRSREVLVEFCNAVFSRAFGEHEGNPVSLRIPEKRAEEAQGGWIESWHLPVANNPEERTAVALGVRDLLARHADLAAGDIAILCRTNHEVAEIAQELEAIGLRASVSRGSLVDTPEGRLVLLALRYLHDPRDTVALAGIVRLSPAHSGHRGWLQPLMSDPEATLAEWRADPMIQALDTAREGLSKRTPLEALEAAIDGARVPDAIRGWGNRNLRMANLDLLRGLAEEYLGRRRARRWPASATGLIEFLEDSEEGQAKGMDADTVQVLTYHSAKGLEWPVVVLTSLNKGRRASVFGTHVVPSPTFDFTEPLAGRSIRFWPWAFGAQRRVPAIEERLEGSDFQEAVLDQEMREARRLLYVGMTRARDGMVFAKRRKDSGRDVGLQTTWLEVLTDARDRPLLEWPIGDGEHEMEIGDEVVPVTVRTFGVDEEEVKSSSGSDPVQSGPARGNSDGAWRPQPLDPSTGDPARRWPPARITPSRAETNKPGADVDVEAFADLGPRLPIKGSPDITSLGSALHGYLGAELDGLHEEERSALARDLLARWSVGDAMAVEDAIAARARLERFIEGHCPDATRQLREWPVALRTPEHQTLQGWVDLLVDTPEGWVIIDHKSFPGTNWASKAQGFAPQLLLYGRAVEAATERPVRYNLIHFPMLGRVVRVR
jgi:ATP-dependent helicase/nuclease subunit A